MDELAINNILFNNWDPLEVNKLAPTDEYIEYARIILGMISKAASDAEIISYMKYLRREELLADENDAADLRVLHLLRSKFHGSRGP